MQVDLARLPDDVAVAIEGLRPGEELVITRDGVPIATIAGAVIEGEIVVPDQAEAAPGPQRTDYDAVTVVATAMQLSEQARSSLSDHLGADYIVVDLHRAPSTADVLLVPPSSPQLIGHLRSMFPAARIVVSEIADDELGVSYRGPVGRMLDAGAETYLPPAAALSGLARQLDLAVTRRVRIAGGRAAHREVGGSAVDPVGEVGG